MKANRFWTYKWKYKKFSQIKKKIKNDRPLLCLLLLVCYTLFYVIHYTLFYMLFYLCYFISYFYLPLNQKRTSCLYQRKSNESTIWWSKKNLCKMNKSIHLFTIGLYLFDTLLSILVLKKEYNWENKQIKKKIWIK